MSMHSQHSEGTMTPAASEEETLEDVVLELMKGNGFLSNLKGQIAQFIQQSGNINTRRHLHPERADGQILLYIYEYLQWIGMKHTCTALLSESPVGIDASTVKSAEIPKLQSILDAVKQAELEAELFSNSKRDHPELEAELLSNLERDHPELEAELLSNLERNHPELEAEVLLNSKRDHPKLEAEVLLNSKRDDPELEAELLSNLERDHPELEADVLLNSKRDQPELKAELLSNSKRDHPEYNTDTKFNPSVGPEVDDTSTSEILSLSIAVDEDTQDVSISSDTKDMSSCEHVVSIK